MALTIACLFVACESNNEVISQEDPEIVSELFEQNEYNLDMRDFALAVSNAMTQSKDFQNLIKNESLKMFDGEYNVLLSSIMDRPVCMDYTAGSLRSGEEYTVTTLLEDYYLSTNQSNLRSASSSSIADLSAKYPNLQVSVPVHADKLDANIVPPITFIPDNYEDGITRYVTGYNPDGSIKIIDAFIAPDEAVIVVNQNERMVLKAKRPTLLDDGKSIPNAPKNLTATQTKNSIVLHWDRSDLSSITGYKIYRKGPSESQFSLIRIQNDRYDTTLNDENLKNGATYFYQVRTYNHLAESIPSNIASAVAPPRPDTPFSFETILNTNKEVELRWATDPNAYIEKLELYRHILHETNRYQLYKTFNS